jgi:type I restriction enzyme M protein
MQDDCYIVTVDGWKAEIRRIVVENKQKKQVDKGWACDLVPKELVINRYFLSEKKRIDELEADSQAIVAKMQEIAEEHGGEEGLLEEVTSDSGKISKGSVQKRLKEIESLFRKSKADEDTEAEMRVLRDYLSLIEQDTSIDGKIKAALAELDEKLLKRYKTLIEDEVKVLVVDDKWMQSIQQATKTEMERISKRLTQRIKELAERYYAPLPKQSAEVVELEAKVAAHLQKMGFVWK